MNTYQKVFLNRIREKLDSNRDLARAIQVVLSCSADSAYRRIRCETSISLDEALLLSRHFKISISDLETHENDRIGFLRRPFINSAERLEHFMAQSLVHLQSLQRDKNHCLWHVSKDFPVFYLYNFPEITAFQLYVQLRTSGHENAQLPFNERMITSKMREIAQAQWQVYSTLKVREVWGTFTCQSIINQIAYHVEAGLIHDKNFALLLCKQLIDVIKLIYKQTATGHHSAQKVSEGSFDLFYYETQTTENFMLSRFEKKYVYHLMHGANNYLTTNSAELTSDIHHHVTNIEKQSILINTLPQHARNKFFAAITQKIEVLAADIKSSNPLLL